MGESQKQLEKLRKIVSQDAGAEQFVELAELLAERPENRAEAREICLFGLAASPSNTKGRLLLSKLYYLDKLYEFSVRELVELRRYASVPSIDRLLDAFGGYAEMYRQAVENTESSAESDESNTTETGLNDQSVVAEIDLDADFVDVLDELDVEDEEA